MNLLHIDSSINTNDRSASKKLSLKLVNVLAAKNNDLAVKHINLVEENIPHINGEFFSMTPENNAYLQQFLKADIVVIGMPMYNFSIPSQLKSWLDHIIIAGQTFRYTDQGPVGLVSNKKVFVLSTRGGIYSGDLAHLDFQESYIKTIFGFIGINNITIIRAEGLAMPNQKDQAFQNAEQMIAQISRS